MQEIFFGVKTRITMASVIITYLYRMDGHMMIITYFMFYTERDQSLCLLSSVFMVVIYDIHNIVHYVCKCNIYANNAKV